MAIGGGRDGERDQVLHCGRERPAGDLREGGGGQADATKQVGISRSAFYKYKDAVQPFNDMKAEHIITFYCMLKDNTGVLSSVLSVFATSGANILTINQSIPTNGCAAVTISAETSGLAETLEKLMADVAAVDGVVRVEVLAG